VVNASAPTGRKPAGRTLKGTLGHDDGLREVAHAGGASGLVIDHLKRPAASRLPQLGFRERCRCRHGEIRLVLGPVHGGIGRCVHHKIGTQLAHGSANGGRIGEIDRAAVGAGDRPTRASQVPLKLAAKLPGDARNQDSRRWGHRSLNATRRGEMARTTAESARHAALAGSDRDRAAARGPVIR
jgi:hypothetical protein